MRHIWTAKNKREMYSMVEGSSSVHTSLSFSSLFFNCFSVIFCMFLSYCFLTLLTLLTLLLFLGSPSNGVPYEGLYGITKLAEICWNFIETQRKEHTRLQVSLFQFISRYSPEFRVLILYHCNPIQTLIWHPVAWASCAYSPLTRGSGVPTIL